MHHILVFYIGELLPFSVKMLVSLSRCGQIKVTLSQNCSMLTEETMVFITVDVGFRDVVSVCP